MKDLNYLKDLRYHLDLNYLISLKVQMYQFHYYLLK